MQQGGWPVWECFYRKQLCSEEALLLKEHRNFVNNPSEKQLEVLPEEAPLRFFSIKRFYWP